MKTVLITGATDGIGRETARQLLSRGFRVLLHGRTPEKAQRVVTEFQRAQPERRRQRPSTPIWHGCRPWWRWPNRLNSRRRYWMY
ncbi:MAG: SDR family NAD(P)-dependent oxidoreductase [Candidatus Competibacteraceae bacterium]